MAKTSADIRQAIFKGHQGSVLCLAHSKENSFLLSGSEDETVRLWDLRTRRAALCMLAGGDVTAVQFAPQQTEEPLAGPFARDTLVYASVDNCVYIYDLRRATSPIIKQESRSLVLQAPDEVNQLSTSHRGESWLAAPNDGGTVQLYQNQARQRTLYCTSRSLITSAVFRPKRREELASGGTDCTVYFWDIQKPRRPLSFVVLEQEDNGANQVCNPPFVHSLDWSPSGRLLAAGLGDGTCGILQLEGKQLRIVTRLRDAHSSSLATVVFPNWNSGSNHVLAQDRLLVTAGTDGAIFLWDLSKGIAGDGAMDPSSILANGLISINQAMDQVTLDDSLPRILFGIPHPLKPNWLVCSGNTDAVMPSTLFVADTSNDITAYTIPMR